MLFTKLFTGLFVSLMLITNAYAVSFDDTVQVQREMLGPSVQLTSGCSGTIIESKKLNERNYRNLVLTAKHCFDNPKVNSGVPYYIDIPEFDGVKLVNTKTYVSSIVKVSKTRDLVVMEFASNTPQNAAIVGDINLFNDLEIGLDVVAVGYPYSGALTYSAGNLGPIERSLGFGLTSGVSFQRATTQAGPGASGCGLFIFHEGHYKLIGVLTGGSLSQVGDEEKGTSDIMIDFTVYFTPLNFIVDFLKEK